VKSMIFALVKVGNSIKVVSTNIASVILELIDVAQSYFVVIVITSSIKVSIYLFEFLYFQTIKEFGV
jgi:hypothetical protein